MTWAWTVLWIVLVVGAAAFLFVIIRSLWRKVMALVRELGAAADRLSAVSAELGAMAGAAEQEEPAIFSDPAELRRRRYLSSREPAGGSRRAGRGRG